MKQKEKKFCQQMAVTGDPMAAAARAGYKNPGEKWPVLMGRADVAEEIRRQVKNMRLVYESAAVGGLYRLACGGSGDAVRLAYRENWSDEELAALDLSNVQEIRRTKDKSVEIKFFDRIKALEKLQAASDSADEQNGSGLLDAMRLSAEALDRMYGAGGVDDAV